MCRFILSFCHRAAFIHYWWMCLCACVLCGDHVITILNDVNEGQLNSFIMKCVAFYWIFIACQQLALAGAVAFWYFRKPTDSPVGLALSKLVKYHLGSAAKGSILITLFKVPRLILTYLYAKWVWTRTIQIFDALSC